MSNSAWASEIRRGPSNCGLLQQLPLSIYSNNASYWTLRTASSVGITENCWLNGWAKYSQWGHAGLSEVCPQSPGIGGYAWPAGWEGRYWIAVWLTCGKTHVQTPSWSLRGMFTPSEIPFQTYSTFHIGWSSSCRCNPMTVNSVQVKQGDVLVNRKRLSDSVSPLFRQQPFCMV